MIDKENPELPSDDQGQKPTLGELLLEIPQDDGEFQRLSLPARPLDP